MQKYERARQLGFKDIEDRFHNDPEEQDNQVRLGHGPDFTYPYLQSLPGGHKGVEYVWPHQEAQTEDKRVADERRAALNLPPGANVRAFLKGHGKGKDSAKRAASAARPEAPPPKTPRSSAHWEAAEWQGSTRWTAETWAPEERTWKDSTVRRIDRQSGFRGCSAKHSISIA